jgi:nucleotide-binding universal stress UspA family protein
MERSGKDRFNKNILIAIDDSVNAQRAVEYVGQILGGSPGFKVLLLHIIPEPEEDYFPDADQQTRWLTRYQQKMKKCLEQYQQILYHHGFKDEDVSVQMIQRFCPSMAECILTERENVRYDTIVVGRQGLSRSEEFLFGSISSKIVTHGRNCTVWVVE